MRYWHRIWAVGLIAAFALLLGVACQDNGDDGEDGEDTPAATQPPDGDGEEVPGVTADSVKLGTHTSLTGPISAYNVIPRFAQPYFDHINETEGGVNGRMIEYVLADDQYNPSLAVDVTRQLVEQDEIFAMFNALGTPNHLQVIDYLHDEGVPDMYAATGATAWVEDPEERPLTFGSNPNYLGEGVAMGRYIAENFAGQNVGVIYQNDDFGQDGLEGLERGVGDAVEIVGREPYEVTDANLDSQVDTLRAADAEVVAFWATPLVLGGAIKHARQDLGWDAQFFISSVSMNELTAAIAGPENIEGTIGPVATYMAHQTDNPGVAEHVQLFEQSGVEGNPSVLTLYSQYVSELMVETLRVAEEPLTREGLIDAAETIEEWTCSMCLFPLTLGPDDHDPAQGVALGVYDNAGQIQISDEAFGWEGVSVDELSPDALEILEVPEDAVTTSLQ